MKFSVFENNKQCNNIHGFPSRKGTDFNNHRFSTFGEAFKYLAAWIGSDASKKLEGYGAGDKSAYYTALNSGKMGWDIDNNRYEIRREEEKM